MRPAIFIAFFAAFVFLSPAIAQTGTKPGIISLQGIGEVTSVPDMAIVRSGVVTNAQTAREALSANTAAMSRLFALLKDNAIEERDIQTSDFSVQPQYVYPNRPDASGNPKPPRIVGYQVFNNVTVRVRDLDNLGALIDAAVTVGANQINSISFAVSDTAQLQIEARRAAMADAIAKAELYVEAAGLSLGRIVSIREDGGSRPVFQPEMARMAMASDAVPVAAGELTFSRQVFVEWELVQED
ncbi:MAG TPA: SIMPL domain-containing protein [Devosia sp.]|nr:SIMPL domain-containing protein [Devosia sp.]